MIDLALRSLDHLTLAPRDALLITAGLVSGVLLWQVEERLTRVLRNRGRRQQ